MAEYSLTLGDHTENEIVGEALIALKHDELKEMGMTSVGHRLTLLKSVYDVKIRQDVPIDSEHYVPLCMSIEVGIISAQRIAYYVRCSVVLLILFPAAEADKEDATATQADIARIIDSIRLRDERIIRAEQDLLRLTEKYDALRKDILPLFAMAKGNSLPPHPNGSSYGSYDQDQASAMSGITSAPQSTKGISSTIGRSLSHKFKNLNPKGNNSPTHIPPAIQEDKGQSMAAAAASSHLTASLTGGSGSQLSPGHPQLPSPTSPPHIRNGATLAQQTFGPSGNSPYAPRSGYSQPDEISLQNSFVPEHRPSTARRQPPEQLQEPPRSDGSNAPNGGVGQGNSSVEIFKSFRVSMDDPCYKVLPAALKKYNINADWKQYALYIVYGDEERCLELEEKPLKLFKQLDNEGRKPMFMLRKVTPAGEGGQHPGTLGPGGFVGTPASNAGGRNQGYQSGVQLLPGGVL